MTLTREEELRIENIEAALIAMQKQINGAASKNNLNRLLVLANSKISTLTTSITTLQTKVEELIELGQKLQ